MTLAARLRSALIDGYGRTLSLESDGRVAPGSLLSPAAVLVAVTDRAEPGLILTMRASSLRKHAGQIAFPGGRVDPTDADETAGALREAEEEIGLPPQQVEIVGTADRYHTFTGFDIIPVIGVVPPDLPLVPQESEVAAVFEMPLAFALDPANQVRRSLMFDGVERHFYEIMWKDWRVWGITAGILVNLSRRLGHAQAAA
ncbi:MAG: CoA pyrophosphatase [Sphingobium sp.]